MERPAAPSSSPRSSARALLRRTVDRIEPVIPPERTVVATRHGQESRPPVGLSARSSTLTLPGD